MPGPPPPALPTRLRDLQSRIALLADRLLERASAAGLGEPAILLGLAAAVGLTVGLGILVFYTAIDLSATGIAGLAQTLPVPRAWSQVAILLLGLVLVRLVVRHGTNDSEGENIPDVVHAVARRGGVIDTAPVLWKTLAAALTLGAGGSVGSEGPVAVLGAGLGSRIGRWLRARPDRLRLLVGCGTSAGIAGAFGAPLAGIFFGLEKLLGTRNTGSLAPLAVAAAGAAVVTRTGLGDSQVILIPAEHTVRAARDLVLYAMVGVAGGAVSVLYSRGVWRAGDALRRLAPWARIALAATLVGTVAALFDPDLWGRGHQHLDLGQVRNYTGPVLLALAGAKLGATALTLAGGGVGGVFTPALVIGGAMGAGLGAIVGGLLPGFGLDPVAFGLVGMAAVVSGAIHAPLTGIFMVIEMSGDWELALPLVLGGALAYLVARRLHPESIYSEWLRRRGEKITHGADESILAMTRVAEVFRLDHVSVRVDAPLREVVPLLRGTSQLEYPVLDELGQLCGLLRWEAVQEALVHAAADPERPVRELMEPVTETVTPADSLTTALQRLGVRQAQLLPVVATNDRGRLVGVIGRGEIFAAYERETG